MAIKKLITKGFVQTKLVGADLNGLIVELFDQQQKISAVIASTITQKKGEFVFELNPLKLKRLFQGKLPEVYLVVRKDKHLLFSSMDEIVLSLDKDIAGIKIDLPKKTAQLLVPVKKELPKLDVRKLLKLSGVRSNALSSIEAKFKRSGLLKPEYLISELSLLTTRRTGLDKDALIKFKVITKFTAASGSESLSVKLTSKGFYSFSQLGALSIKALTARVGKLNKKETEQLNSLYLKANNIRNNVLNQAAFTSRLNSRDGFWKLDPKKYKGRQPNINEKSCQCKDCKNVFSPFAYLISLLDMIHDHWELAAYDMEQIFLQQINDISCENGYECFLQIELAIEVLEKSSRTQLPLDDAKFTNEIEQIWTIFLFGSHDRENIKLFMRMGKINSNFSDRLVKLILDLRNPASLKTIKKNIKELKHPVSIRDLNDNSPRYANRGDDYNNGLDKVYQAILVSYRDALIRSTGQSKEMLQKELYINLKAGPCNKTNRLTFLILSLQSFVLAGRTGQVAKNINPTIRNGSGDYQNLEQKLKTLVAIPIEEASWKWMKDYPSWASAMYAFLYPENIALPFLEKNIWWSLGFKDSLGISRNHIGNFDFVDWVSERFLVNNMTRVTAFLAVRDFYLDEDARQYFTNQSNHFYNTLEHRVAAASIEYPHDIQLLSVVKFMEILKNLVSQQELLNQENHNSNSQIIGILSPIDYFYELNIGFYFPLVSAWTLNKSEEYASAHEWYSMLYDPVKSGSERLIFDFDFRLRFAEDLQFESDWENGLLDPNAIVRRREGSMLRYVILMMVKNLLDWADHEFSVATTSSLDRARQLYELAQEVLDSPDLRDHCGQSIKELTIEIVIRYGVSERIVGIVEDLNLIDDPVIIQKAIDGIYDLIHHDPGNIDPPPEAEFQKIIDSAVLKYKSSQTSINASDQIYARNTALALQEEVWLEKNTLQNNNAGISSYYLNSQSSTITGLGFIHVVRQENIAYVNPETFCVPPNPVLVALDAYIKLSLLKFQLCLDIAGEPLPRRVISEESAAEFFDAVNTEAERQPLLNMPENWFNEPPRYRYSFLIEKAKQYTEVAQRMGSALHTAQVGFDNERFAILKAQHAIELASSTIDLRNLGLRDAQTGLDLANLQADRAVDQLSFWQDRINAGMLSDTEQLGFDLMIISGGISALAGTIQGVGAIFAGIGGGVVGAVGGATGASSISFGAGAIAGMLGGGAFGGAVGGAIGAALPGTVGALGSFASFTSTFGSAALTHASFERRLEDWELQKTLSAFDSQIAQTQKISANNRIDIAHQELTIANLQNTQAKEVLTFLENKFSNDQLYEWMIQVLSQNYRTLMQISASVAKLAQRALEFERQKTLSIIVGDYWSINSVSAYSGDLSDEQKTSGLLGAERLLTDLTRLDAYKTSSDQRRLQMSKTISMAQVLPSELVELKSTGTVIFNTLMHWFDRDFPGHYLRLIKSIRISILALTPPTDGIHAILSNSGESTVIVPDGLEFKSIRSFRDSGQRIALDSPFNETGLFVFDYNDPMLLPFEGLGVETPWVLEMPKASNRFNFDTIVDVMLTIEYTALHSDRYAGIISTALGTKDTNDVSLTPRLQNPDEWYHFKSSQADSDDLRKLKLPFPVVFLPPHYTSKEDSSTKHVTVIISGDFTDINENQLFSAIKIEHHYFDKNAFPQEQTIQVSFITKDLNRDNQYAFLSTRNSNDISHELNAGISPIGEWEVSIKDSQQNNISLGDRITDVLLVVTIEGEVSYLGT